MKRPRKLKWSKRKDFIDKCTMRHELFPGAKKSQVDTLVKKFRNAKTMESRLKISSKYYSMFREDNTMEQRYNQVKDQVNFKSEEKAKQFRTEGNTAYKNKDRTKAFELFTKSIAYAPLGSRELSHAYADRVMVLRSLGKCRECLVDIDRAMAHGYPSFKSTYLMIHQLQCHRDLKNTEEMNASYEKALNALQALSEYDFPGRGPFPAEMLAQMRRHLEEAKVKPPQNICTEETTFPEEVPELSYGASTEVVGASSAVRIEYNEQQGRHLVATRDIDIGDVLLITEHTVVALLDEHKYTHCAHCHKPCFNLMPCQNCVWVMFCSEKCQTEAGHKYHNTECAAYSRSRHVIIDHQYPRDVSDRVIRLLAMIGSMENLRPYLKYARTNTKAAISNEAKRTKGLDRNGVFDPSNIDTIFNLYNMIELQHQTDLLNVSLSALQIPRCFGMPTEHPEFHAVAGLYLLLQNISLMTAEPKAYYNFETDDPESLRNIKIIADCLNPLQSLLNHSCISNLSTVNYGNKQVSKAIWPIAKGSVLTVSYHKCDLECTKEQRQKILFDELLFLCKCVACENDWRLEDVRHCMTDPADLKLGTEMSNYLEEIMIAIHRDLPNTLLAPLYEPFLKKRRDYLTKMWNKKKFTDIRCHVIQLQLSIFETLQGNRVIAGTNILKPEFLQDQDFMEQLLCCISVSAAVRG